eukprot:scpid108694/ scgid18838/ 
MPLWSMLVRLSLPSHAADKKSSAMKATVPAKHDAVEIVLRVNPLNMVYIVVFIDSPVELQVCYQCLFLDTCDQQLVHLSQGSALTPEVIPELGIAMLMLSVRSSKGATNVPHCTRLSFGQRKKHSVENIYPIRTVCKSNGTYGSQHGHVAHVVYVKYGVWYHPGGEEGVN